jgi:hypothetical protein
MMAFDYNERYAAVCQSHEPWWIGAAQDEYEAAEGDAERHNASEHDGNAFAGVLPESKVRSLRIDPSDV